MHCYQRLKPGAEYCHCCSINNFTCTVKNSGCCRATETSIDYAKHADVGKLLCAFVKTIFRGLRLCISVCVCVWSEIIEPSVH